MVAARNRPVWRGLRRPRHLGRPGQRLDASRHQPRGDVQVHHVVEHRVACRGGCPVQERHRDLQHDRRVTLHGVLRVPTGHIATAGHCVEWSGSKTVAARNNVIAKLKEEGVTVEKTGAEYDWAVRYGDPTFLVKQPSVNDGPEALDSFKPVVLVDYQSFEKGDNAILKLAGVSDMPVLSIATQRPGVRDTVIYAGFPADVEDLTLDDLQTPTVKEGKVSSLGVSEGGVPVIQLDTLIPVACPADLP